MEIGMGAELAIQASNQSTFSLHHFADTVMVNVSADVKMTHLPK
jgi:hypothetical protein